ncbi:site-specific integrase [Tardiphaga sp. OK245]|uniref:tyrosine-type recombinase/integrase n=1 Tax=Tardiphaga sp. OK245 TaxID=1855306 RepID=UPI0008A7B399|nr:site-specific integrase [Tardiphaga sp. OK245]SEI19616.1 Site-specific recombinase XerD [Tardiphaga sp. OK245]
MTLPNAGDGIIVRTDASCVIYGRARPGIPVLFWPEGIDETVSDWLRHCILYKDLAPSTVVEYAKILRPFLRFCRREKRDWRTVDDEFLVQYRDKLLSEKIAKPKRVNEIIQRVFSFYCWAERRQILNYHVGIYTEDERDSEWGRRTFPLTGELKHSGRGRGRKLSWQSVVRARQGEQRSAVRHTPTTEQILDLHRVVMVMDQAERNSLMMSWAELTGARRFEFLQICRSDLPSPDKLAELQRRGEDWLIVVRRKGGRFKRLVVPTDLIEQTLNYIAYDRAEVVLRCANVIKGYIEPDHVFISSSTGVVLHPDSVTSIGRRAFRRAGIKFANIHRLRARFAIRTIENLVDGLFENIPLGTHSSWIETILIKAAELMGHGHPASLRPYLTYVLNRRLQASDANTSERLRAKIQRMTVELEKVTLKLVFSQELASAGAVIRGGSQESRERRLAAASKLYALADELAEGTAAYELSVSDDGAGVPSGFDPIRSGNAG